VQSGASATIPSRPSAPSHLERTTIIGPGTRLGRYEIIAHLASGGMASVYLARMSGAEGFQRLVAIKRLHAHIAGDDQFVQMFMNEAQIESGIRPPARGRRERPFPLSLPGLTDWVR
jgi:serine/threonine protein kinase